MTSEELDKLKVAIAEKANIIASTFGPKGQNVLIQDPTMPYFTQDGYRVIEEMAKRDKSLAAKLLTDAARQVAFTAGDGTTTTCLLVAKALTKGIMLDKYDVPGFIKPLAKEATQGDLVEVATVASKNEEVGAGIGGLIWRLGADGYITSVPGVEFLTETIPGYALEGGAILPQSMGVKHPMIQNGLNHLTVYEPLIAMVAHTLSGVKSINSILQAYDRATNSKFDRPLVLVLADIEGATIQYIGTNVGKFPIIAVSVGEKNPNNRHNLMSDLGFLTGSQVYSKLNGKTISNTTGNGFSGTFGTCKEVMIDMEMSRFICNKDATERIKQVRDLPEDEFNTKRASLLDGAIGLITIGAPTMAETRNLELAVEDAVRSAQSAIKEGYVTGGPQLWRDVGEQFPDLKPITDEIVGMLPEGSPKDSVLGIMEAYKTAASLVQQLSNTNHVI